MSYHSEHNRVSVVSRLVLGHIWVPKNGLRLSPEKDQFSCLSRRVIPTPDGFPITPRASFLAAAAHFHGAGLPWA